MKNLNNGSCMKYEDEKGMKIEKIWIERKKQWTCQGIFPKEGKKKKWINNKVFKIKRDKSKKDEIFWEEKEIPRRLFPWDKAKNEIKKYTE